MTIRGSVNLNGLDVLHVGKEGGIARALLQFQDLPPSCDTVESAKLNMFYKEGPVNPARTLQVHMVCNAEKNLQAYKLFS